MLMERSYLNSTRSNSQWILTDRRPIFGKAPMYSRFIATSFDRRNFLTNGRLIGAGEQNPVCVQNWGSIRLNFSVSMSILNVATFTPTSKISIKLCSILLFSTFSKEDGTPKILKCHSNLHFISNGNVFLISPVCFLFISKIVLVFVLIKSFNCCLHHF